MVLMWMSVSGCASSSIWEPRQQHLGSKERRNVQTQQATPIAYLQLLGDGFEPCKHIVHVLQVFLTGFGQCERMRSACEQCHTELLFERPDLVADRGSSDEQFLGCSLEAQPDGGNLKGLEELE
jgi:hypothetical protein